MKPGGQLFLAFRAHISLQLINHIRQNTVNLLRGLRREIVLVQNVGAFALCQSEKEIRNAELLLTDAMKVAYYAEKFGTALKAPRPSPCCSQNARTRESA